MINLKRTIGIFLTFSALFVLAHTLYGSIFYASSEDNGPSLAPVALVESKIVEGETSEATPITSNPAPSSTEPSKPIKPAVAKVIPPKVTTPDSAARYPSTLNIPSLNVNAKVQYVGINAKGNMGTPNNFTDVSWYKPGTIPGDKGSAVMAGHVDNALALSGVFKRLGEIKAGDDVYITRQDGTKVHFKVDRVAVYGYKDVPTTEIFTASDAAHLNLVTCGGEWLPDLKTYSERLIVYTTLVK